MGKKPANPKGDDPVMDMDHYPVPLKALVREWHVIKGAPISFIVCSLIVGAVIWIVLDKLYAAEIRAKDATIQTLALRPESNTPSQEEVSRINNEIKVLREREVNRAAVEWPSLSEEQVKHWRQALAQHKIESLSLFWTHTEGSQLYASIARVMEGTICKLNHEGGLTGDSDFVVFAASDDPVGDVMLKLLNQSGYRAKMNKETIDWNQWRKDGNAQITIFVGRRN